MSTWNPELDVSLTDSEDEEQGDLKDYTRGREILLFVIDAGMFGHGEYFDEALNLIRSAFISSLLVRDKDLLGIMFANTEHSPKPIEVNCLDNIVVPPNCAVFLPLRQLSKAIVEHLLQFVATAMDNFADAYGTGRCNYANMLRLCCNLIQNCGYEINNASIIYLTDCELPHETHTQEYQRALQKAKDLGEMSLEFHVIPMVDEFNYDLFYKEFLTLMKDDEPDSFIPPNAKQLREILADRKLKQDFLKRTLGHFKFSLGPGLEIGAQFFRYFKNRSYPRKVKLMRKDNSIVKQKRVIMVRQQDPETMECSQERELKRTSGWYEINVGSGPAIRITTEQFNRVRNLHGPGMLLLGFKPKSSLPENMYYKPCQFMYPDDGRISGSKRLFRALWQRCLEREKIAICLFVSKRKSIVRFVALVPVIADMEQKDKAEVRTLLSGDGFKIIYLPFGNNIREIDFCEWNSIENEASDQGVDFFKKVIQKLRMKYEPNLINDPRLELLQSNLLALALDIKTENGGRTEMPDATLQNERIEHLLPDLEAIFGEDAEVAKKRPASGGISSQPKMAKITMDDVRKYDYVEQLIANKTLESCTVAQLRLILDEHFGVKAPASDKKQNLIDRISELSV